MENNGFKRITAFLKKNVFACACLLLAILVAVTGTISYSAYLISGSGGGSTDVASFSVSATVDGVSALSFTNTAFWGGSAEEDKIAMNALRSLNFSVNNFKSDAVGNQKVADVKMKYSLTFSSPKNFAEKLAVQVFDEDSNPLLPQIVIADLIKAGDEDKSFLTADSKDYNGVDCNDVEFTITKSSTSQGVNYYAKVKNGDVTVSLERYQKTVERTILLRAWDTSSVTSEDVPVVDGESGKLQPPLTVTFSEIEDFYRISVSAKDFVFPAGKAETRKYSVRLAPTDAIVDDHLGGRFVDVTKDENGNVTSYEAIKSIYADEGKTWTLQTTSETQKDDYYLTEDYSDDAYKTTYSKSVVIGNPKRYSVGDVVKDSTTTSSKDDVTVSVGDKYTSVKVEEETAVWNTPTITDTNLPTKNSSDGIEINTNSYVGMAARKTQEGLQWGTTFYVHKLKGTQTGTQTVTETTTESEVVSSSSNVTAQTEVSETSTVTEVVGAQDSIKLNVTKTTKTTVVGNFTVKTTTTVKTYTRNLVREGYFYLGYYIKADTNKTLSYWDGTEEALFDDSNNAYWSRKCVNDNGNEVAGTISSTTLTSTSPPVTTNGVSVTSLTNQTTEYLKRTIERAYNYSDITVTKVSWAKRDENGNAVYDENGILQTQTYDGEQNALNFYEKSSNGVDIQLIYLSQCYSKTFPFFVNVVFEQVL